MSPDTAPSHPPLADFKEKVKKLEQKGERRGYWLEMPEDEVRSRKEQVLPFLAESLGKTQEEVDATIELDRKKLVIFGASHEKAARGVALILNQNLELEKHKRGLEYQSLSVASTSMLGPEYDIPAGEVFILHAKTQLLPSNDGKNSKVRMSLPLSLHEDVVGSAVDEARRALDLLDSVKVTGYKNTL